MHQYISQGLYKYTRVSRKQVVQNLTKKSRYTEDAIKLLLNTIPKNNYQVFLLRNVANLIPHVKLYKSLDTMSRKVTNTPKVLDATRAESEHENGGNGL